MIIYEIIEGYTFKDLLENIRILKENYSMPFEVINFQETQGRFKAFLKLEERELAKPSKEDLENDTICSHCLGHADIINYIERIKLCYKCYEKLK